MNDKKILIELENFIDDEIKYTKETIKECPFYIDDVLIDSKVCNSALSVYYTIKNKINSLKNE